MMYLGQPGFQHHYVLDCVILPVLGEKERRRRGRDDGRISARYPKEYRTFKIMLGRVGLFALGVEALTSRARSAQAYGLRGCYFTVLTKRFHIRYST